MGGPAQNRGGGVGEEDLGVLKSCLLCGNQQEAAEWSTLRALVFAVQDLLCAQRLLGWWRREERFRSVRATQSDPWILSLKGQGGDYE